MYPSLVVDTPRTRRGYNKLAPSNTRTHTQASGAHAPTTTAVRETTSRSQPQQTQQRCPTSSRGGRHHGCFGGAGRARRRRRRLGALAGGRRWDSSRSTDIALGGGRREIRRVIGGIGAVTCQIEARWGLWSGRRGVVAEGRESCGATASSCWR